MEKGFDVLETDLIPQNKTGIELDFLDNDWNNISDNREFRKDMFGISPGDSEWVDIITNPPYKYAKEWVEKSMNFLETGEHLMLFLKLTFLEGQARRKMFKKYPPKYVYVFSKRQKCAMNGDFENTGSSAAAYAWYVWEKDYEGDTIIKWI